MAKRGKTVELLIAEGKKHFTKAEIAERLEIEAELNTGGAPVCPPCVRDNFVAIKKWREIIKRFKDKPFFSAQDTEQLALYCMAYAEWESLEALKHNLQQTSFSWTEQAAVTGDFACTVGQKAAQKLWDKIEYVLSQQGILELNRCINDKARILTALSDRLYLNPRSRAGNLQKKPKEKEDPLQAAGFGGL